MIEFDIDPRVKNRPLKNDALLYLAHTMLDHIFLWIELYFGKNQLDPACHVARAEFINCTNEKHEFQPYGTKISVSTSSVN
jgi:hypothetical protein